MMLKRSITCFLMISWAILLFGNAFAAGPVTPPFCSPQYTHISTFDRVFNIQGGSASCFGSAQSRYADTTTTIKVTLMQREVGKAAWSNVCSWQAQNRGKAYTYVDEQMQVSVGFEYQILVQCTISDTEGAILETDSIYSQIIPY